MLRTLRFSVAALLLAGAGAPSALAASADGLRAMLAFVPATAARPRGGGVSYFDFAVAATLAGRRGLDGLAPMSRRLFIPSIGQNLGSAGEWKTKTGFTLEEIEAIASGGEPPNAVNVFRLAPSVRLETLTPVWAARGFREMPSAAGTIWGRGTPGTLDFTKVDSGDPFGGMLGRSSFLVPALPFLAESFLPDPPAEALRARSWGGLAARADVTALLALIDRGGLLLQAQVMPDTAAYIADGGAVPYSALIMADIEHAERAEAVLLLAFPDCAAARAALASIEARWAEQSPAVRAHTPLWTLGEGSPCTLVGRVTAPGPAAARNFDNPAYRTFVAAWQTRDLIALIIRPAR